MVAGLLCDYHTKKIAIIVKKMSPSPQISIIILHRSELIVDLFCYINSFYCSSSTYIPIKNVKEVK